MKDIKLMDELLTSFKKEVCKNCQTTPCKPDIREEWDGDSFVMLCRNFYNRKMGVEK